MRSRKTIVAIVAVAALAILGACASTTAPPNWLPDASETQTLGFGSWISLAFAPDSQRLPVEGEFIAVEQDTVFVLTIRGLTGIHQADISAAELTNYQPNAGWLAVWTLLGALSTPSHGYFLVLSAPLWIITGSVSTAAQSHAPQKRFPRRSWVELRPYARFPQGLPPGIDRNRLRGKPYGPESIDRG